MIVAIFVITLTAFVYSVEKPQMVAALSVEGFFFANGAGSQAAPTTPERGHPAAGSFEAQPGLLQRRRA